MIHLFNPFVNEEIKRAAVDALGNPIIGQGKKVELFEKKLGFLGKYVLTVNSGTSALELAYDLLRLKPGDEVISPVFTFIGTNLLLKRRGVKVVFADVTNDLLMDWNDVREKITKKTKAIVNVHLFGLYNKTPKMDIPVVGDACQYLDKTENERFTTYSFQATKIITTVDGGALVCKNVREYKRAKLLRWFGIDRETGKDNVMVDSKEPGYKYHMNDVTAGIGLEALKSLRKLEKHRMALQGLYKKLLCVEGGSPFLIYSFQRDKLRKKLLDHGIETGLMHRRNDIYSIFGGKRQNLPNMNLLESKYLFLPCHHQMTVKDVEYICSLIKKYE